jgi:hypothetical protein
VCAHTLIVISQTRKYFTKVQATVGRFYTSLQTLLYCVSRLYGSILPKIHLLSCFLRSLTRRQTVWCTASRDHRRLFCDISVITVLKNAFGDTKELVCVWVMYTSYRQFFFVFKIFFRKYSIVCSRINDVFWLDHKNWFAPWTSRRYGLNDLRWQPVRPVEVFVKERPGLVYIFMYRYIINNRPILVCIT